MPALPSKPILCGAPGSAASPLGEAETLVAILVVVSLVASWVAAIVPMENAERTVGPDGRMVIMVSKTPLYYAAHGLSLGSVLVAGFLAALLGGFRTLSTSARCALFAMLLTVAAWTAAAYSPSEMFGSEIFEATGPFVWLTLIFLFAGTDRRIWPYVDPAIRALAYATTVLAVRAFIISDFYSYDGFSHYIMYAQLLVWLGGWTLLTAARLHGPWLLLRAAPLVMAVVMAVVGQSRSWILLAVLLAFAFIRLRSRELGSGMRTLVMSGILFAAAAGVLYNAMPETLNAGLAGLSARLDEDTRSGQYTAFFSVVPVADLVLGRGPRGTWFWRGVGEYQYFDNGYLWTLFVGGVPTLLSYVLIVVWPAIRTSRGNPVETDAAAVYLVLCWALALTGLSTFCLPSVGFTNYLVSLWAGRCHLLLAERATRELAVNRKSFRVRDGRRRLLVQPRRLFAPSE
jgi:hypothetical protein